MEGKIENLPNAPTKEIDVAAEQLYELHRSLGQKDTEVIRLIYLEKNYPQASINIHELSQFLAQIMVEIHEIDLMPPLSKFALRIKEDLLIDIDDVGTRIINYQASIPGNNNYQTRFF